MSFRPPRARDRDRGRQSRSPAGPARSPCPTSRLAAIEAPATGARRGMGLGSSGITLAPQQAVARHARAQLAGGGARRRGAALLRGAARRTVHVRDVGLDAAEVVHAGARGLVRTARAAVTHIGNTGAKLWHPRAKAVALCRVWVRAGSLQRARSGRLRLAARHGHGGRGGGRGVGAPERTASRTAHLLDAEAVVLVLLHAAEVLEVTVLGQLEVRVVAACELRRNRTRALLS